MDRSYLDEAGRLLRTEQQQAAVRGVPSGPNSHATQTMAEQIERFGLVGFDGTAAKLIAASEHRAGH